MKSKLLIAIGALFIVAAMVLSTSLLQVIFLKEPPQRMPLDEIRGMAIEKGGELYTLNFGQQNLVAMILNSLPEESFERGEVLLHIYRFEKPSLVVPIGKQSDELQKMIDQAT